MHRLLIPLLLALATPGLAQETDTPTARPDLVFNLGPLGARAKVVGNAIVLTAVMRGQAAARARLKPEDHIVSVDSKPIPAGKDPIYVLAAAIKERMAMEGQQVMALGVKRGGRGKESRRTLKLTGLGIEWAQLLREDSFKLLSDRLLAYRKARKGHFPTRLNTKVSHVTVSAMIGLAALADGGALTGRHGELLRGLRAHVVKWAGKETTPRRKDYNNSQVNWSVGFGGLFLAELRARKKRDSGVSGALRRVVKLVEKNQEPNGGYAHGPGGPNVLKYTDFAAVTNVVIAAYGAAGQTGIKIKPGVVDKALKYLEGTSGAGGTVGYAQRPREKGGPGTGRTGAALVAYTACGKTHDPFFARMKGFVVQNLARLPEEHASPMYHMAFGAWGASLAGAREAFLKLYELELLMARNPDGSFYARPSKENLGIDQMMGEGWSGGAYLLAWTAAAKESLPFKCVKVRADK